MLKRNVYRVLKIGYKGIEMKRLHSSTAPVVLATILLGLAACSPTTNTPSLTTDHLPTAQTIADNAIQPMVTYEATLEGGIDFRKPGYPTFITDVSGVSGDEPWGRWTDANLAPAASFHFKEPLPTRFTLELTGYAIGPNAGQPIKIIAGDVEKSITLGDAPAQTISVEMDVKNGTSTIELVAPKPIQPSKDDTRKLGLALVSLKVKR